MNKNGIVSVVFVITVVMLVGLWVMRSSQTRPGGRQFDCTAPPEAPTNLTYAREGDIVSGTWTPPASGERPTMYIIEVGSQSGLNDQGTVVVPASETTYKTKSPAGTYYARVFARSACGTSPASNEVTVTIP
jgi:hypothetical protein